MTPHLAQLGAVEVPRGEYLELRAAGDRLPAARRLRPLTRVPAPVVTARVRRGTMDSMSESEAAPGPSRIVPG